MPRLPDDLLGPGRELRETHTAWAVLDAELVYKVKKPIKLPFLDFSSVEQRRHACLMELELNRRLAPDVYLRVAPLACGPSGRLELDAPGEPVDWALVMRRMPDDERGDELLSRHALGPAQIDRMARRLAEFHRASPALAAPEQFASQAAIQSQTEDNLTGAAQVLESALGPERAAQTADWQRAFVAEHGALFEKRLAEGRVREQHGDLKLEHFYLGADGSVTILDCVEFSATFRSIDAAMDLAFLSMDLRGYDEVRLAERLLSTYAQAAFDYGLFELIDFYESFRACVRAKTSDLLAQGTPNPSLRASAATTAKHYATLTAAIEKPPFLKPVMALVGGCIASGKSTVAAELAFELGAAHLSSDATRKHLAAVAPTEKLGSQPFAGAYSRAQTDVVYAALRDQARAVLQSGRPVVLDASFSRHRHREAAWALATELDVPLVAVECWASRPTLVQRLRARADAKVLSDGRLELLDTFQANFESMASDAVTAVRVNTEQPTAKAVEQILDGLAHWPSASATRNVPL